MLYNLRVGLVPSSLVENTCMRPNAASNHDGLVRFLDRMSFTGCVLDVEHSAVKKNYRVTSQGTGEWQLIGIFLYKKNK